MSVAAVVAAVVCLSNKAFMGDTAECLLATRFTGNAVAATRFSSKGASSRTPIASAHTVHVPLACPCKCGKRYTSLDAAAGDVR